MSRQQKGMFWMIAGLIMTMGCMGGVEQTLDLLSWDGVWLFSFTAVGIVWMMVGAFYINEDADETIASLYQFNTATRSKSSDINPVCIRNRLK